MKYTAETTGAAVQIANGANSGSGEEWPEERVTECKHRRPLQSTGGNCIIFCRKATKVSQKQIKEDISKHQRKACSTALESFRGNNPERVTGKSLLCFPSVFRETGFTMLASTVLPRREKCPGAGQAGCEDTAPGMGVAEGQPGHSFSLWSPVPQLLKTFVFEAMVTIPTWACAGRRLSLEKKCGFTN